MGGKDGGREGGERDRGRKIKVGRFTLSGADIWDAC